MPTMPDVESIKAVLRQVIDPEVGVNIVDLGLVYGIDITPDQISIRLTMTSPACPMGDLIMGDIDAALDAALPPEIGVVVNMVWDPPWTPEMMNKDARGHFGWKGHDER